MSDTRPLPDGWFSNVDPNSGQTYYYQEGGNPQWNFPGDPTTEEAAAARQPDEPTVGATREQAAPAQKAAQAKGQPTVGSVGGGSGGKTATSSLLSTALFPFTGTLPFIIWLACHATLALVELISGFSSLGQSSHLLKNGTPTEIKKNGLLAAFLIVDAIIIALDTAVHLVIMSKPAKYLLAHPPSIEQVNMIPFQNGALFGEAASERTMFFIRMILLLVTRIFQIIWMIVGTIDVATTTYFKINMDTYETTLMTGSQFFGAVAVAFGWASIGIQLFWVFQLYMTKRQFLIAESK